ncbi:MAG: Lrp/AsnC family transcriptional regulator [Candidatus Poseidoniaceae archaeon]|jgi:Lrp/AsnC family leucine-responsive transcriptional regulator|nr:Lrp/AsnC family transcriptional regulator [Candidatus Poseidoniaceae archaeon]MDP7000378.1 Lrp/AsnC family transcriptional regulator [Candidatus Poseidoniaceae archaeon]
MYGDLDEKDSAIIDVLRDDGRISIQAMADRLGLPRVTVHDRLKKLVEKEIITGFSPRLDRTKLGQPLHGFIQATYERQAWHRSQDDRREIAKKICELPFVVSCHIVTGDWDFLIEVVASSMDALGDAILDSLSHHEGVGRTHTMVSFYDFEGKAGMLS